MKHKRLTIALIASTVAAMILVATLSVYAYFTTRVYVYTEDGKEVAHVGMNLQLLFGKLSGVTEDSPLGIPSYCVVSSATGEPVEGDNGVWFSSVAEATAKVPPNSGVTYYLQYRDGTTLTTTYNSKAPWGSAQNPYIISEARHLQNLSALQSVGYFDLLYVANNFDANGNYIEGSASIPYFLICADTTSNSTGLTAGQPITISGEELAAIKPIGSAEHPFIGVVGGAFTTGTTTVIGADTTATTDDKTSSVSAIHGFKVQTNTNQTDVGLFGYVGYLGTEPSGATAGTKFNGAVSVIQNFLLSDLEVKVENPSLPEIVSDLLGLKHVFENHRFTYTGTTDSNGDPITPTAPPHENHHIGIFAGHVSYAHAEYISVYYSDDNKCAIDLLHTNVEKMNYHSSTGIVGFMHNMNSTITNQSSSTTNGGTTTTTYSGHCQISYGGISSSGVNVTPDTPGAGGGKEIGLGRGYVVAKTLYEGCHYISANQGMNDRIWKFTVGGQVYYGPMFYTAANGTYVSQNGKNATIVNGTATEEGSKAFNVYAIRTTGTDGNYVYTLYEDGVNLGTFTPNTTTNVELPMSVWEYVLTKPLDENGNPIEDQGQWTWVEAVLLEQQTDNSYILTDTLYKNKYAVTVSGSTATINGAKYADGSAVTIQKVFFKRSNGQYSTTATGDVVTPEFFREKPLLIAEAKTMLGTELCIQSESSPGKYFYDGVFTFALSNPLDTIESTWENETPDQIVIGPNANDQWTDSPYDGYYGVVAYIKPIKNDQDWNDALDAEKEIFIGYDANYSSTSWYGHTLNLMTFDAKAGTGTASRFSENFYQMDSNQKSFYTETERDLLYQALQDDDAAINFSYNPYNLTVDDIIQEPSIQVLDLEAASNIQLLTNKYLVEPQNSDEGLELWQGTKRLSILNCSASNVMNNFSIYAGTNKPENESDTILGFIPVTYYYYWNTIATISFTGTGACNLSYTYNNETRYVQYSSGSFNGIERSNTQTKPSLYLYTVEAMSVVKTGQLIFEPTSAENKQTFDADQYVLWPQAILKNDGTYSGTYNGFDEIQKGVVSADRINTTNATATKTDGGVYDTYKLISLSELFTADNGWQDGYGIALSNINLRKKFTMQEGVDFSLSLNIPWFGIGNIQTNDKSVIAPVGEGGATANIPTGSIAFRINETTTTGSSIYVIVSVPVSKFYDSPTNTEALNTEADYYLGLWQTQDIDDDAFSYNTFSQTTALQKFELPRSRPYDLDETSATADYILVQKQGDSTNTTYRCYLNGERVLVAYRFTVTEAGTYILGTAIGDSGLGEAYNYNYPMEIVYCAADGTASEGRDGTSGSVFGALDYVYDYENTIVHVQDYATGQGPTGAENYTYYYNSHIITYTVNETSVINSLQLWPRRYVDTQTSKVKLQLYASDTTLIAGKHAGMNTDTVIITQGEPPNDEGS